MVDAFADPGRQRQWDPLQPRTGAGLSPDGNRLYLTREGELSALEVPSRRQLWHAAAPWKDSFQVLVSPEGARLLVATAPELYLYDAALGTEIAKITVPNATFAFAGGRLIVGEARGKLLIVDPATGAMEHQVASQGPAAAYIFGSSTAPLMATGAIDGTVRFWNTSSWTPLAQQSPPGNEMARLDGFSSDGRLLLFFERSRGGLGVIRVGDAGALR